MQINQIEAAALMTAAVQAAERAAQIAARRATGFEVGQRVVFQFGSEQTWMHASVHAMTLDLEGRVSAWLRLAGGGAVLHREPVSGLRHVCGACADCQALNDRPGCMQ